MELQLLQWAVQHVFESIRHQRADHVEGALELDIIRLSLQFVVPVGQGVGPPLQHNASWHGCTAGCITLAKGLQHHCTSRKTASVLLVQEL